MGGEKRGLEGKGYICIYMYKLGLIHGVHTQKPTQNCKAIFHQLKKWIKNTFLRYANDVQGWPLQTEQRDNSCLCIWSSNSKMAKGQKWIKY